jgi:hypothetical protein
MPPTIDAPINLSFRIRLLFGLTARAELARLLFTMEVPGLTSTALARAAGFTERNVHEALSSFELAGVVPSFGTGYELRYGTDHERWAEFLGIRESIEHVDWIPILLSLRRTLRWILEARIAEPSDYLPSSSARDLLERIRPDLRAAAVDVPPGRSAATALDDLSAVDPSPKSDCQLAVKLSQTS